MAVVEHSDIPVGTFWRRQQNGNAMKVLAVVDGFVMYRHRNHHPGVVTVSEWLSSFRRVDRTPSTAPVVSRIRRTRV